MAVNIRRALRKFLPHILKAKEDNLSEADTVQRVVKVFEDVLGYDPMSEITHEAQIKEKYVDLAIKVDGSIRLLVEVKAVGCLLRDRHIEQALHYAAEGNIEWVLLTNTITWNLYHVTFGDGVDYVRVFSVDLTPETVDKTADCLRYLHHHSLTKRLLDEYWQQRAALSSESICRALFTEDVLRVIRREIRRKEGILIDEEDLAQAIHEMFSTEAREQAGPLKIRRRPRKHASKQPASNPEPTPAQLVTANNTEGNGTPDACAATKGDNSC